MNEPCPRAPSAAECAFVCRHNAAFLSKQGGALNEVHALKYAAWAVEWAARYRAERQAARSAP